MEDESLRTESPRLSAEVKNVTKLKRENVTLKNSICEVFRAKNNDYRPEKREFFSSSQF